MQPLQELPTPPPPTPTLPPASSPVADATATPPGLPTAPGPATPAPGTPAPATPVPVTPPTGTDAATSAAGQQPVNLAALTALIIYLIFFGVIGYRRGSRRELIVLVVALSMSFLLQRFSEEIVILFDRFGKGLAFIAGQPIPAQSGLGAWATANTATLLIMIWLAAIVTTYFLTARFVHKSSKDGWAVILGVLNGLILASIFAPLLTALIFPNATIEGPIVQLPVISFLGNVWQQITNLIMRVWEVIEPYASTVFFLGVILLTLIAAMTLRTNVKPKS